MASTPSLILAAFALATTMPWSASCAPTQVAAQTESLAHPRISGAAGPYRRTTLTLVRNSGEATSSFTGILDIGAGKRLTLAGPDEPDGFFYLDVKAVIFTPIDRTQTNGVVVLYNSSKLGPGNGTDRRALVYRVEAQSVVRQPVLESRLEGVKDAGQARARLARVRR